MTIFKNIKAFLKNPNSSNTIINRHRHAYLDMFFFQAPLVAKNKQLIQECFFLSEPFHYLKNQLKFIFTPQFNQ
jgi:hypothetical protein